MIKISSAILAAFCFVTFGYAETTEPPVSGMGISKTKIADLEKLVAEGKARKAGEGAYVLPDKFILNGKEHPKTQYGGVVSSQNSEYFLFEDTNMPLEYGSYSEFFDKRGNLLWKSKTSHGRDGPPDALVSNNGIVVYLYGELDPCSIKLVDKTGRVIISIPGNSAEYPINGDILENFYKSEAQFVKNSNLFFAFAYFTANQLVLLGIDDGGEIKFFEKVNPSMKTVDWYARVYFNPKRNQFLIDSGGIGEAPPMLSYWSFPQKKIFNKKTVKDEIIYNASFADNDDILLLIKKKDGSKVIRRLNPAGKEKVDKSDVSKMDAEEHQLFREKPVDVRSLRGCENGDKYSPCR